MVRDGQLDWTVFKRYINKCQQDCTEYEAACHKFPDDTFGCICPHDSSIPQPPVKCPRRTVPMIPSVIRNIHPGKKQTINDTVTPSNTDQLSYNTSNYQPPTSEFLVIFTCTSFLIMALVFILMFKRRTRDSLRNLLEMEQYTRNATFRQCSENNIELQQMDRNNDNNDDHDYIEPNLFGSKEASQVNRSNISQLELIGEGYFARVYKGILHRGGESRIVAVKILKESDNLALKQEFRREINAMSSFDHPNILSIIGYCAKENDLPTWIISEYMPFGDLTQVLRNGILNDESKNLPTISKYVPIISMRGTRNLFNLFVFTGLLPLLGVYYKEEWIWQNEMCQIALQIAEGMKYLVGCRYIHRDLACRNCLMGPNLTVKISDFGLSRAVHSGDYYKVGAQRLMPIRWMSPESICFGKFTFESDIWSYGIVLWEIYNHGKHPYYGYNNEQAMQLILSGILLEIPSITPKGIRDIMMECWKPIPKERITFGLICRELENIMEKQLFEKEEGYYVNMQQNDETSDDSE